MPERLKARSWPRNRGHPARASGAARPDGRLPFSPGWPLTVIIAPKREGSVSQCAVLGPGCGGHWPSSSPTRVTRSCRRTSSVETRREAGFSSRARVFGGAGRPRPDVVIASTATSDAVTSLSRPKATAEDVARLPAPRADRATRRAHAGLRSVPSGPGRSRRCPGRRGRATPFELGRDRRRGRAAQLQTHGIPNRAPRALVDQLSSHLSCSPASPVQEPGSRRCRADSEG